MSRTLSAITQKALNAQSTDRLFLVIIEIDHTDLASPIRIVNDTVAITSNGDVYSPVAFKFSPPVEEDGTIRSSSLTIGNIDRSLVEAIRSIDSAPTVDASIIRYDTPNVIEAGPWSFKMRNVSYNVDTVRGELIPDNPLGFKASILSYRNIDFPGIYG